ncbi:MAG: UvrB/UvrC motif-containing protein [Clostridia bacterium]|nr:UvrB/UvrC motif-containing protein [Clostridia bacterium]
MLCDNCKENQATVRYTEIINGEKKEMHLCEECSHKLGIDNISFNMPINFSSFFGGLLDDYNEEEFMPLLNTVKELKCDNCNLTYDEFINQGKFGCEECYDVFSNKIDSLLKRLHGSSKYVGRKALNTKSNVNNSSVEKAKNDNSKIKDDNKLEKLQDDLKKAIAEERYEDAAKIRDEITSLKGGK